MVVVLDLEEIGFVNEFLSFLFILFDMDNDFILVFIFDLDDFFLGY